MLLDAALDLLPECGQSSIGGKLIPFVLAEDVSERLRVKYPCWAASSCY